MCTLTFIPSPEGITVTQNRDESPLRGAPIFPYRDTDGYIYPKDPDGDGTWMLTDGRTVVCVLNGAYEPHDRKPPYRHSRGLLPKMVIQRDELDLHPQDAQGLEPFSVFIFNAKIVRRYSWDGNDLYREEFDASLPHIFQSAPLYSPSMQAICELWFEEWLTEHPDISEILDFHLYGGDDSSETNICMYRPGVQTTAITQVDLRSPKSTFYFKSILTDEEVTESL